MALIITISSMAGTDNSSLVGAISPNLSTLSALVNLTLSQLRLSGTSIPASLGNLTALRGLDLSGNNLTGTIPRDLGKLTKLLSLNLEKMR